MVKEHRQTSILSRLSYIDKASGFAILCVVYGHILFPETRNIHWYYYSSKYIYKFHMELFMCISGYLAFLSTSKIKITTVREYLNFQKKKIYKFLPVYLFFSLIGIGFDIYYKHVNGVEINHLLYNFFFRPTMGSAAYLWYIYVLFIFYLITPFLLKANGLTVYGLIIVGIVINNFDFISIFNGDLFCKYFIFFYCGGLIFKNSIEYFSFLKQFGFTITILTLILITIDLSLNWIIPYQLLSTAIILSVFYISNLQWPTLLSETFVQMGKGSFAIYLLNTTILYLLYFITKIIFKVDIDAIFIFSSLILTIPISLYIRKFFNKTVPNNIYIL